MKLTCSLVILLLVCKPCAAQDWATSAGLQQLLREHGLTGLCEALGKRIGGFAGKRPGQRYLASTKRLLEAPVRTLDFTTDLTDEIRAGAASMAIDKVLERAAGLLDHGMLAPDPLPATANLLDQVVARVDAAAKLCDRASLHTLRSCRCSCRMPRRSSWRTS